MTEKNYYDEAVAARYDRLRRWRNAIPKKLAEIARLDSSSLVLDLGCGTGNLARSLMETCSCRCIGLDLSRPMIGIAAGKLPRAGFVQGDCSEMPLADGCFDSAVGSFFLHHIPIEMRPKLIDECYRVLSKGCLAIITRSHEQLEASHYHPFFPEVVEADKARFARIEDISEWMSGCGFVDVGAETVMDIPLRIDDDFLHRVENKLISTLDLIDPEAFKRGLVRLRQHIEDTRGEETVYERPLTIVFGEKV